METDRGENVRLLREDERLALVSALRELTVAALQLFDPAHPVSEVMLRIAERLGCVAALCVEARGEELVLLGDAGLSQLSRALPIVPPRAAMRAGAIDWERVGFPFPELGRPGEHHWAIPISERSADQPARALFLYFRAPPRLSRQLRGMVERLVAVLGNALAHRRLYARLLEQNALMRSVFDATSEGILIVSPERRVLAFNRRLLELWGLDSLAPGEREERLIGTIAELVQHPEEFLATTAALREAPDGKHTDEIELRDGRVFERDSVPIFEPDGLIGRGWYFRDVTERKQVENDRLRLLAQEQAARAAAEEAVRVRDEFLSVAAHELKTPLTPLLLRLNAIGRAARSGLRVDPGLVEKARGSLKRLSALINDLLDFSRVQAGRLDLELQPCSLDALVREVVQSFQVMGTRHEIVVEAPVEARVRGDPTRLEQVVTNLIDNAIKYSPAGGTIRVTLEEREGEAVLSVSDPGIGIPSDQQELLFERFFRGRNAPVTSYGGLGLGLFICRDIVERHGGRIWFESKLGAGSTFHVALPLLAAARRSVGSDARSNHR